jgi:hypothetical protein
MATVVEDVEFRVGRKRVCFANVTHEKCPACGERRVRSRDEPALRHVARTTATPSCLASAPACSRRSDIRRLRTRLVLEKLPSASWLTRAALMSPVLAARTIAAANVRIRENLVGALATVFLIALELAIVRCSARSRALPSATVAEV